MYESADICQYLVDTYGDGSGVVSAGRQASVCRQADRDCYLVVCVHKPCTHTHTHTHMQVPNGITGFGSTLAIGLALAPRIGKGSKAVPVRFYVPVCLGVSHITSHHTPKPKYHPTNPPPSPPPFHATTPHTTPTVERLGGEEAPRLLGLRGVPLLPPREGDLKRARAPAPAKVLRAGVGQAEGA